MKHKASPARLKAYKAILDKYYIDPNDTSYSGGEDAGEYVRGEKPIEQFCVVTRNGEFHYAYADDVTIEGAKEKAMMSIDDIDWSECPMLIINLDTGERIVPDWNSLQWMPE